MNAAETLRIYEVNCFIICYFPEVGYKQIKMDP